MVCFHWSNSCFLIAPAQCVVVIFIQCQTGAFQLSMRCWATLGQQVEGVGDVRNIFEGAVFKPESLIWQRQPGL